MLAIRGLAQLSVGRRSDAAIGCSLRWQSDHHGLYLLWQHIAWTIGTAYFLIYHKFAGYDQGHVMQETCMTNTMAAFRNGCPTVPVRTPVVHGIGATSLSPVHTSNMSKQHVECCRPTCCRFWQHVERFFRPFDISKQIEHVQFLSTCRTKEQQLSCCRKLICGRLCRHVERSLIDLFIPCLFVSVVTYLLQS